VTVDLALTGSQYTGNAGLDKLSSVVNLVGSSFDDILRGNAGTNVLNGGAGDDALDGGIGTDTATYADATGRVIVDLALTGAQDTVSAGLDTLTSVENLVGSSFDDILRGNAGSNVLNGGAGHDLLWGGAGNDSLIGGVGIDTASYAGATSAVTANLLSGLATGGAGNDTLNTIENLIGSGFNDRLIGDLGVNRISGGNGVDVVTLGGGNDVFVAEIGATPIALRTGSMSVDIITDFDASGNDFIDLSGLGVAFNFRGTSANRNAGDLTYKMFDSVNGAESALGFDIDGYAGASGISGPVTVVYGNTNGGTPEFAIILLNTRSVEADDFIFHTTQAAQGSSIPMQTASHAAFDLFV
jgi:Ca2+-binding RTX toxin-like protein